MLSFLKKYKPQTFDDFIIDKNVINIIKILVNIDCLNILLIGDGGSGKTSILNVIINEYYGKDHAKDNILFINNLQEQGVQYYRNELKTFCQIKNGHFLSVHLTY